MTALPAAPTVEPIGEEGKDRKKYIPSALILLFIVLAVIAYFAASNPALALISATCGVLVWALVPSGLGHSPGPAGDADPKELKTYRKEHPGSTVADAVRATRKK